MPSAATWPVPGPAEDGIELRLRRVSPAGAADIDVKRKKSSKRVESLEPFGVRRPWN
ncbi:hypothetical protein ACWC24_18975 [Streptomyces sp. NPDC001443]